MALTTKLYNTSGKIIETINLAPEVFDVTVNAELIALAIRVYQSNQRQSTSKVKTRSEVTRTTKKIWRQKGTGRARHGDKGAPIFVGGGVAHGPTGKENYTLKLPKKMRQLALKSALTQAFKSEKIIVIDNLESLSSQTKKMSTLLENLSINSGKSLILLESTIKSIINAGSNIPKLFISQARRTNTYEVVHADNIIIHKPALDTLYELFSVTTKKAATPKPTTTPKIATKKATPKTKTATSKSKKA
jgi:large subunit ribosomal protein L4